MGNRRHNRWRRTFGWFGTAGASYRIGCRVSAVYTPLQRRRLVLAVAASSVVGLIIDSAIFLYLAFGNLDFLAGQVVGKAWMVLLALPLIMWLRNRDKRLQIEAV